MVNRILNYTDSLCPVCYSEIPALVLEEEDKIYMMKKCDLHGEFKTIIEEDVHFYKKMMNRYYVNRIKNFRLNRVSIIHRCLVNCGNHCYISRGKNRTRVNKRVMRYKLFCCLMLPVTHKCNLDCNVCYLPYRDREDLSFDALTKIIDGFRGQKVSFTGGEPTLREDLYDLINFASRKGKIVSIATNGVRLAEYNYVKGLKNAGLKTLVFSFNGLRDYVYEAIEGRRLLNTKLKALDNLRKQRIETQISMTLVKGLNENEVASVYHFCVENLDFITNLRIRSEVPVGRSMNRDKFFLSQLLKIFADAVGIDRSQLMRNFRRELNYSPSFGFSVLLYFQRNGKNLKPFAWDTNIRKTNICFSNKLKYLPVLFKKYYLTRKIERLKQVGIFTLWVDVFSWPTRFDIDLNDVKFSHLHHLTEDRIILPFNYALIHNEQLCYE